MFGLSSNLLTATAMVWAILEEKKTPPCSLTNPVHVQRVSKEYRRGKWKLSKDFLAKDVASFACSYKVRLWSSLLCPVLGCKLHTPRLVCLVFFFAQLLCLFHLLPSLDNLYALWLFLDCNCMLSFALQEGSATPPLQAGLLSTSTAPVLRPSLLLVVCTSIPCLSLAHCICGMYSLYIIVLVQCLCVLYSLFLIGAMHLLYVHLVYH